MSPFFLNDEFFDQDNVIISIGRLTVQKNYSTLIDAFQLVVKKKPDLKLIILGEGNKRKELEENNGKQPRRQFTNTSFFSFEERRFPLENLLELVAIDNDRVLQGHQVGGLDVEVFSRDNLGVVKADRLISSLSA